MTSITYTRAKSSLLNPVHSTLDPLLSVLAVIRRVHNGEVGFKTDDRAERETLSSIRSAAFSIRSILSERALELDLELTTRYSTIILGAVEDAVKVDACHRVLECTPSCVFKKASKKAHPRSHALCHSADFSFPTSAARDHLRQTLTDTFDELQISLPDNDEALVQPTRKRRRDPQWGITTSAGQAFHAISQCRHGSMDCGIIEQLEAHLALAAYLNTAEEEEQFIDLLFALETERPRCDEVRIYAHSPTPTSIGRSVMFADELRNRPRSMKRLKKLEKVPHFCDLLGVPKRHSNAVFRVNVSVGADQSMWLHRHTPRVLKQEDVCHPVSLADILASDTRELSEMAKLVLAVVLSYSLYYLFEGPWLGPRQAAEWSQKNIIFFKKRGEVPLRPFLRSDLSGNNLRSSNENGGGHDEEELLHQYPVLLCFGITLLEIHLGGTLESFLGLTEPLTNLDDKYARACEVFEKRKPFIRQEYREAIKACLNTQFGASDEESDWSEDEDDHDAGVRKAADEYNVEHLRDMIFSEIVRPLHDELENSFGTLMEFQDNLDKQAANMDLRSGLSVADVDDGRPTKYHAHNENLTHEKAFRHSETSRVSLGRAGNENLHALSGDSSPQLSVSTQEHGPTDNWFARFRRLEALSPLQQLPPGDPRRVRVAIIDTGVDMGHIDIQAAAANGQIVKVCDWVDGREGVEDENIGDFEGHGTHIASVILDMAPHVDLYIARVTKQRELFDGEAENVAKAIRTAAFTWNCDIISLSLGFTRGVPCIQTELESAIDAGALVFAAASNDGANSGLAYPAWHSRVLCIYSTDGYGNKSPFNPPPEKHSGADGFSIIGQHIRGAWPSNLSPEGANDHVCRLSGTSCATPVAAALAAFVLGFASFACEPEKLKAKSFLKLTSYDGMRRVLWKMTALRDGYQYLNPFQFFSRQKDEIENDIWKALNPEK